MRRAERGSAILGEVGKEFVKVVVEAVAVTGMAGPFSWPPPTPTPEERLGTALTLLDEAAYALRQGQGLPSEGWDRWSFIAQRSLFEVLQELPGPALEDYALDLLRTFTTALQHGDTDLIEQVISHLKERLPPHHHP